MHSLAQCVFYHSKDKFEIICHATYVNLFILLRMLSIHAFIIALVSLKTALVICPSLGGKTLWHVQWLSVIWMHQHFIIYEHINTLSVGWQIKELEAGLLYVPRTKQRWEILKPDAWLACIHLVSWNHTYADVGMRLCARVCACARVGMCVNKCVRVFFVCVFGYTP